MQVGWIREEMKDGNGVRAMGRGIRRKAKEDHKEDQEDKDARGLIRPDGGKPRKGKKRDGETGRIERGDGEMAREGSKDAIVGQRRYRQPLSALSPAWTYCSHVRGRFLVVSRPLMAASSRFSCARPAALSSPRSLAVLSSWPSHRLWFSHS